MFVSSVPEPGDPAFAVVSPQPGQRVQAGEAAVHGTAVGMASVEVNGEAAPVSSGVWQVTQDWSPGIHAVEVQAVDRNGEVFDHGFAVLAGEFAVPESAGRDAIRIGVDKEGFSDLGPVATALLDTDTLLSGVGGGAPLFEDSEMAVYLAGIEIPTMDMDVVPRSGFLDMTLGMPGLTILLDVETKLWLFEIEVNANLRIAEAAITGDLYLDDDGKGGLDMAFEDVKVHVQDVELDIDGLADFFEDMLITDEEVEALLADNLDPLAAAIPALLDDALGSLGEMVLPLDLMGAELEVALGFSEVDVSTSGLEIALDMVASGEGVSPPESLVVGIPEPDEGLAVQLSDDALNHLLEVVWAAGGLDLTMDLEPGSLDAMLLAVFGGEPSSGGSLSLQAGLPPVVVGRDGEMRLQLGECLLTVLTPGGEFGDEVQVVMTADMALQLEITDEEVGAKLSDATVKLVAVGDSAEQVGPHIEDMEATVAAGIGLLNGLLTFPLSAEDSDTGTAAEGILGGLTLPPFDLSRDPSDRATWIELDVQNWTP